MGPHLRVIASCLALAGATTPTLLGCSSSPPPSERTGTSTSPVLAPFIGTFAVFAERGIFLGQGATVMGGGVGVAAMATVPFQMIMESGALVDPTQTVFTPSIALASGASVGALQANRVDNAGGSFLSTSAYVVTSMPPVPLTEYPPVAGANTVVAVNTSETLSQGNYGALTVNGTVYLNPGTYSFASVTLGPGAALYALPPLICGPYEHCLPPVTVAISGRLRVGAEASFGAYEPGGNPIYEVIPPASNMTVTVAGNDATGAVAAEFLAYSTINALISVPKGSLALANHVSARGAFSAFNLSAGPATTITYNSGLTDPASLLNNPQQLTGYYGPSAIPLLAPVIGPAPSDAIITLDIGLPTRTYFDKTLPVFVSQVSDPRSSDYRHYLSQAAFAAAFGATPDSYNQLTTWATANGFVVDHKFPNRLLLAVHASVAQVEQALSANLVLRQRPDGSPFVTVDREPSVSIPSTAATILWISGLDDFIYPMPLAAPSGTVNGTYPGGAFSSADLRSAYLLGTTSTTCAPSNLTTAPSACSGLTGAGQVVGIYSYVPHNASDIAAYDALQTPPINPKNVLTDVEIGGLYPSFSVSTNETPMDIEMVQAMAPNAKIVVFDEVPYASIFNLGHVDAAFHSMATNNPPLTVASCSWEMGRDSNEQQALYEMAMQGVSFFQASGDFGDLDDPQDVRDLDSQTLVGGTYLSTSGTACGEAYVKEATWNNETSGGGATGGGVMNGEQNLAVSPQVPPWWLQAVSVYVGGLGALGASYSGVCLCWPYPTCCGPPVPIPFYQIPLQEKPLNSGNAGSMQYRNYPDVSMVSANLGIYSTGATRTNGGTSAAAPLWAGFMALANELSVKNKAGTVGFANPALYEIGQTRGAPVDDLYSSCFRDIRDGVMNGPFGVTGYASVTGYDLATGLGTPTCNLIYQLGTTTPLTPHAPLYWMEVQLTTGHDDLRSDSAAEATVRFHNGAVITVPLKPGSVGAQKGPEWNNGSMVTIPVFLPDYLSPDKIPTEDSGIDSFTLRIVESGSDSDYDDNWDVSGFNVRLAINPGGDIQEACQFDIPDTNTLQDGNPGVVRLSASNSGSGVGPEITFATPQAATAGTLSQPVYPLPYYQGVGVNNCAVTGSPMPPSGASIEPGIQFIFSTGSDNVRTDSGIIVYLYDSPTAAIQYDRFQLKASGAPEWRNDTQQNFIRPLKNGQVPDHMDLHLQQHNQGTETDDKWNVDGVNIVTWQNGGPEVCYYRNYQSAGQRADGGDNGAVFTVQDNYIVFSLQNCHAVSPD